MSALVLLAAGGTGGHVFPAEALAASLQARGFRLALATDRRAAAYGGALSQVETHRLSVSGLGGGIAQKLRGAIDLGRSLFEARALVQRLRPAAVIGFGGYPSLPTVAAAARARVATAIHEQNAVLGRANRFLAPRVAAIATSFPSVRLLPPSAASRVRLTGNPVRPAVVALRSQPYHPPAADGPFHLLVTGGSQGATVFSRVVPQALASLPAPSRARLRIVQQCRAEDIDAAREAYRGAGIAAELATFFSDLPQRLAAAHLMICRSGASTVAELAAAGRPAVLVPYPHAMDDHQTDNAKALVAAGAGWLMPHAGFTAPALAGLLAPLLADPAPLAAAAAGALSFGRPDAADRLADLVAGLIAPARAAGLGEAA